MEHTVERKFYNLKNYRWTYQYFDDAFKNLIDKMRDKIGPFKLEDQYNNLRFVMNIPLYNEFRIACAKMCDSDYLSTYKGIRITIDPSFYIGNSTYPDGIVRLVYEEPELKKLYEKYCVEDAKATYELMTTIRNSCNTYFLPSAKPHIDHVKFNGPATIVFWKDGTKTVVKHDGKGRKDKRLAVLYAFIRKIYGEGKPYHNILNEIEEAIK